MKVRGSLPLIILIDGDKLEVVAHRGLPVMISAEQRNIKTESGRDLDIPWTSYDNPKKC